MHRVSSVSMKEGFIEGKSNFDQKQYSSLLPCAILFCQLERNIFVSNSRDAGSEAARP